MLSYQKRVVEEKGELDKRILRLRKFIDSGDFVKLVGANEQVLLCCQLGSMV